jgi:rod shape determining protein RodA
MLRIMDPLRTFFRKGDVVLLALCLIASGFGLVLIYSATRYDPALRSYPIKQAIFIAMGVVVYVVLSFVDIELFTERSWKWMFLFNVLIILLLIPFGVGKEETGNNSWLALPFLPVTIQPAEIAKLFFILLLSLQCARYREWGISSPGSVLRLTGHTLFMAALIAGVSGDFGMVLVYVLIFAILLFSAGVKLRWFALGGFFVAVLVAAVTVLYVKSAFFSDNFGYIIRRFTEPFTRSDPQGIGWQQIRSVLAIGSGRLTGQGYLKGTQTQSAYESSLPARHTDEIFAVCGEEFGLVGCILVLLVLGAIIVRCFWVARNARSHMSAYIAMGYGAMLLIQTAINVAFCLYLFPVVGLTLPFISAGGSSILTLYAAMGVVSGIKMRSLPSWLRDRSQL